MAHQRGKQRGLSDLPEEVDLEEPSGPFEELMRRAIALGLTGFFTTEGAVRKAFGDAVPKDWTDFIADTSERTRSEFLERLSHEIASVLETVDIAAVLRQLLEGRTLEVKAEFKLSDDPNGAGPTVRFSRDRNPDEGR